MVIRCRQCHAAIPAENINRIHSLARCLACQTVFPILLQSTEVEMETERPLVPMPPGFTVDPFDDALNISKCGLLHPYIPFIIIWLAVGAFTFSSCFVVPLVYLALAGFFNTTQIRVAKRWLRIEHDPFPRSHLRRQQPVEANRIQQLYCVENHPYGHKNQVPIYEIWLVTTGGKQEKLLTGLTNYRRSTQGEL
jgi:hypothetical protein